MFKLLPVALEDDKVVEIQGEPSGMHKALELIANHLRKFLIDRSILPLFEMHHPHMDQHHMHQNIPPSHPWAHQGDAPPMGGHPSTHQTPPMSFQDTQDMQVPLSYADAVIGTAGANISYIRPISSANVSIQESMGVSGEMTVEIIGSANQVQTAQQQIQNFVAGGQGPGPVQRSLPPANQGYGSYPGLDQMHTSMANTGPGAY